MVEASTAPTETDVDNAMRRLSLAACPTTGCGSPGKFVGFQNFRDIFGNEVFRQTVYNPFLFTTIAVIFKTLLGVWLAMLLFRNFKFKRLIRGAVLLPWVIPTALSLAWG
jgi:multiple sugar transport system permease protein